LGRGAVGRFVNGAAVDTWGDSSSYKDENIWHSVSGEWEKYAMDVCNGHSANGIYHHHAYSQCLADRLDDVGSAHSPICKCHALIRMWGLSMMIIL